MRIKGVVDLRVRRECGKTGESAGFCGNSAAPEWAKSKIYGVADKAWQVVVGCDPHMRCAPRCWARKTVSRIVECQKAQNPGRAEFYQIALTPDGQKWSGQTLLDERHLLDPLKWRKPAVIATGFHGDWGRLSPEDIATVLAIMSECPEHEFMPLTKCPDQVADLLRWDFVEDEIDAAGARLGWCHANAAGRIPLPNVSIGCSVMNQPEADKMLPHMKRIAELGWRTHVWHEPALGPVDWHGWEFLELLIYGGESGKNPRPADIAWARSDRDWCRTNGTAFFCKQLGARPRGPEQSVPEWVEQLNRKGDNWECWPDDLRVREIPEVG